jgi:hypothetical protein
LYGSAQFTKHENPNNQFRALVSISMPNLRTMTLLAHNASECLHRILYPDIMLPPRLIPVRPLHVLSCDYSVTFMLFEILGCPLT